jgi:hypothetical protein
MIYFLSRTALAGNPSSFTPAVFENFWQPPERRTVFVSRFVAENIRMGGVVSTREKRFELQTEAHSTAELT